MIDLSIFQQQNKDRTADFVVLRSDRREISCQLIESWSGKTVVRSDFRSDQDFITKYRSIDFKLIGDFLAFGRCLRAEIWQTGRFCSAEAENVSGIRFGTEFYH
jgi:hypothetical protein